MPLSEPQKAKCLEILGPEAADFIETLEPRSEFRRFDGPDQSTFARKLESAATHARGLRKAISESGEKGQATFAFWLHEGKIKLPGEPGAAWDIIEPLLKDFEEHYRLYAEFQREGYNPIRRNHAAYQLCCTLTQKWFAFYGELPPTAGSSRKNLFAQLFAYFLEEFCPDCPISDQLKQLRHAHAWGQAVLVERKSLSEILAMKPKIHRP